MYYIKEEINRLEELSEYGLNIRGNAKLKEFKHLLKLAEREVENLYLPAVNNCPNCGSIDIDKDEFFCNNCSEYYDN